MKKLLLLVGLIAILPGCYHATIETGLAPGSDTITDRWADAWIAGLVEPSAVHTMERCSAGVARVETRLSFPNQLVNFLTLGIYTPMEITVTCAAGAEQNGTPLVKDADAFADALQTGGAFYVDMSHQ